MAIAAASTSAYWFITRGSAIVALILLTLTVALGVASVKRIERGTTWMRVVTGVCVAIVTASLLTRLSQRDLHGRRGARDRGRVGGRASDQQRAAVPARANLAGKAPPVDREALVGHAAAVPVGERV